VTAGTRAQIQAAIDCGALQQMINRFNQGGLDNATVKEFCWFVEERKKKNHSSHPLLFFFSSFLFTGLLQMLQVEALTIKSNILLHWE
jgi:hypothetical protein